MNTGIVGLTFSHTAVYFILANWQYLDLIQAPLISVHQHFLCKSLSAAGFALPAIMPVWREGLQSDSDRVLHIIETSGAGVLKVVNIQQSFRLSLFDRNIGFTKDLIYPVLSRLGTLGSIQP